MPGDLISTRTVIGTGAAGHVMSRPALGLFRREAWGGTVSGMIGKMRDVAPPRQQSLDDTTLGQLRDLTQALIAAKAGAAEEHARFLAIRERGLCLPEAALADRLRDATVLVTGGTGCIGSMLIS